MSVRVRFAPSPTGLLHVGALRTAVFNDLFARGNNGSLVLRIEDTDRSRYNPESEAEFIETLKWVGITFDEGPHAGGPHAPYRQSERKEAGLYEQVVSQLIASGAAYRAFDTPEQLEEMREFQRINKMATGYFGGEWRDASHDQVESALATGQPHVVRLRIPHDTKIVAEDAVRGRMEWEGSTVDDPVLIKADGMPTYHFAAIVDDHLMAITHVFRGDEWISSYPKHVTLYRAMGWDMPVYAHCPVIVGNDGKKLSKRHGATRVLDYAAQGYLPQPLRNFVALIGWSPGDDREVMTDDELGKAFGLGGIQPSPGKFDIDKLKWMNGCAIRAMSPQALVDAVLDLIGHPHSEVYYKSVDPEIDDSEARTQTWAALMTFKVAANENIEYVTQAVTLEQERVTTLADFGPACRFFFTPEVDFDQKAVEKWFAHAHVPRLLTDLHEFARNHTELSVGQCDEFVRAWAAENGFDKIGPVVHPTRVALTGKTVGPGLFELMSVLGPTRMAYRIEQALRLLPQ